jgi:hypothetical protein
MCNASIISSGLISCSARYIYCPKMLTSACLTNPVNARILVDLSTTLLTFSVNLASLLLPVFTDYQCNLLSETPPLPADDQPAMPRPLRHNTIYTFLTKRPSFYVSLFSQIIVGVTVGAFVTAFAQQAYNSQARNWNIVIIVALLSGTVRLAVGEEKNDACLIE